MLFVKCRAQLSGRVTGTKLPCSAGVKSPTMPIMSQTLDDYVWLQQRNQRRLASETKKEWERLKILVSQFTAHNKGIGTNRFTCAKSISGEPCLTLGNVTAAFSSRGEHNGIPQNCKILFTRKERTLVLDSHLAAQTWSLQPEIVRNDFVWRIRELGKVFSPGLLVEEIATQLTRHQLNYQKQVDELANF